MSSRTGHWQATIDTKVPLAGLSSGEHVLDVVVTLPNGQSARRAVPFSIK